MTQKRLRESVRKFSQAKEPRVDIIDGELGIPLDGRKIVEVPGRAGFVYVRIRGNQSELIQAYNASVSPIYGLPVLLSRDGNIYKVISRNLDRYRDWGNTPYLPKHGFQHSFNHELGMGADITWVYSQQFMPMLAYPSGTDGSMFLSVVPYFYEYNNQWKYSQTTGTPSFTPYLPSGSQSVMCLLYVKPSDNSLQIAAGSQFSNSITGSAQIAQYIPSVPGEDVIPLAAVRLTSGTTGLLWDAVYDVRKFLHPISSGSGGSSSSPFGGIAVQDEGVPLGTGTTLNFVGPNIDASISGSVVRVFVTGSASSSPPVTGSVVITDEGVLKGSATTLDFIGSNVDVSISGSVARVFVTGSATNCGTYQRVGAPVTLSSPTGSYWRVPDSVYASGSLAVFNNGHALFPGVDYVEHLWVSGTYQYLLIQPTGTYHLVMYGVPCTPQTQPPTGSASQFWMQDSDSVDLQDSDGIQILDSDG